MSENPTEVILGGVVLAAALGFVLYAGQVVGLVAPDRHGYMLGASFQSAQGIAAGSDVRMAGVKVGSVASLSIDPATFRAEMEMRLRDDLRLPEDSAAIIAAEGLMGGNFVEILPGGSPYELGPGDRITDTQSAISLVNLLLRAATGGEGGLEEGRTR